MAPVILLPGPRHRVLGGYFAGEVETVGNRVTKFKQGDQVFGCTRLRLGAYGEYVCLSAGYTIVLKSRNLSFEETTAPPLGALKAMIEAGEVRPVIDKVHPASEQWVGIVVISQGRPGD